MIKNNSLNKALHYLNTRQFEAAAWECEALLAQDSRNVDAIHIYSIIHFYQRNFPQALAWIEKALLLSRKIEFINTKANILVELGSQIDAEKCYRSILEINPDNVDALLNIGILLNKAKRYSEAISFLSTALDLAPSNMSVINTLGQCYWEQGNISKAESLFNLAITLNPGYPPVHVNLLKLMLERDGPSKHLEKEFSKAASIFGNIKEIQAICGDYFRVDSQFSIALQYYLNYLSLNPTSSDIANNLSVCLMELGKFEEAINKLTAITEIDPNYPYAWFNLFSSLACLQKFKELLSLSCQFLHSRELSPGSRTQGLVYQSICNWIFGNISELKNNVVEISGLISHLNKKDKSNFVIGYYLFLKKLSESNYDNYQNTVAAPRLSIIGDSHCLSLLHKYYSVEDNSYTVDPQLIIGCKIWHLISPKQNRFREAFKYAFNRLPKSNIVLISIGEIDCRINEGIINQLNKTTSSINEITSSMAMQYLNFLTILNQDCRHKLIILGIPAPTHQNMNYSIDEFDTQKQIISSLNINLKKYCVKNNVAFLDIYQLTSEPNGQAKSGVHLDGCHLQPHIYQEALSDLKI